MRYGTIDHLRLQLQVVEDSREKAGDTWQENDLVFPSLIGTPLQPDRLSNEFPALARKAGLPVIRFHDCRHTAATLMLSHGIPPVIVAGVTCPNFGRMLGHSISILLSTYAHFIPTMHDRAAHPARKISSFGFPLAKSAPLVSQQNTLLNPLAKSAPLVSRSQNQLPWFPARKSSSLGFPLAKSAPLVSQQNTLLNPLAKSAPLVSQQNTLLN